VLARHARIADEDGKVSGSCAPRRQEWRVAPVIKNKAQDGLGQLRAAQIQVARRAPSCVLHARRAPSFGLSIH
ncbi:hypothetical protein A2U01_0039853, partial [Trifolium medium]|nr:hypothetical protein [Trifolium medium]